MFSWDWEKIKIGVKLRKEDDDSIWEVTKQIDKTHYELTCISKKCKNGKKLLTTLSNKSVGWSTNLNLYEFSYIVTKKIYANSEQEAKKYMKSYEVEILIKGNDMELVKTP